MESAQPTTEFKPARLYYLDWLRVLAMATIFLFHSNRAFNPEHWHINNNVSNLGSDVFIQFCNMWMMPLFFVLSGAAIFYSLKSRSGGAFAWERFLRLIVPLLIVGIWVLSPPQVYLERLGDGEFIGSFFQFYPHYFEGIYGFGGNFAFTGVHLWYLLLLFVFSLLLLPLFLPRIGRGRSLITRFATLFEKPWALLLLFIPLAMVDTFVAPDSFLAESRQMGGWILFSYLLFLIYGYLIFSNDAILATIKKYAFYTLGAAVVLTAFTFVFRYGLYPHFQWDIHWMNPGFAGLQVLRALVVWCWILALLGLGARYLNFNNRFLGYTSEAVLPFYILHQPLIVVIGFYIVQLDISSAAKILIIIVSAFSAIALIYETLVRRINIMRFLFGMRWRRNKGTG